MKLDELFLEDTDKIEKILKNFDADDILIIKKNQNEYITITIGPLKKFYYIGYTDKQHGIRDKEIFNNYSGKSNFTLSEITTYLKEDPHNIGFDINNFLTKKDKTFDIKKGKNAI